VGADDEAVGVGQVAAHILQGDPGAHQDGEVHGAAHGAHLLQVRFGPRGGARDDDAVGVEEGGGLGGGGQVHVLGQGVAAVLFLDVGENGDAVGHRG